MRRAWTRPLLAAALLAPLAFVPAGEAQSRLNVLFIVSDDLNNDLGCYGHPLVRSPGIDALARRGVVFDRAYSQFPLCSPSRSSFLTGRRPNATRVLSNPGRSGALAPHFRDFIPDTVTLPQLFRNHGYFAARVGKLYHYGVPGDIGTGGLDDYRSWDLCVNPRGRDKDDEDRIFTLTPDARGPARFGGTLSWLAAEGRDAEQTDGIVATESIRLLEQFRRRGQPFFLAVGFYRPHTPFVAPKKYFDLYPRERMRPGELHAGEKEGIPAPAYGSAKAVEEAMSERLRREAVQAYYASTTFMDAQVGRVLDALDRLGLGRRTIVVFTSDHGYHLGEHGLWQKMSLFEQSARVPLIIAAPDARANGRRAAAPVELIDLYPTLAELCGLPAPDYLDGVSLKPMLDDAERSVKAAAFTQLTRSGNVPGMSVRTARWRYTEWDYGAQGAQLHDLENDPGELVNLAGDPAHAGVVAEMRDLLLKNWPKQ